MAAVGRGGRASRSGTPRAAKTTTATKTSAAKAARPTKRATTKASATSSRTPRPRLPQSRPRPPARRQRRRVLRPRRAPRGRHEEGDDSAGQVDKGAGEGHDRPVEPGGGRPHRADEEDGTGQGVTEQARRPVHIGWHRDEATDQGVDEDDSVDRGGHRGTARLRVDGPRAGSGSGPARRTTVGDAVRVQPVTHRARRVAVVEHRRRRRRPGRRRQQDFEREQELSIAANRLDLLTQIKRAVERIDAGTYGYCESCGKPIPKARLKAFPMATLDVACKQREERR